MGRQEYGGTDGRTNFDQQANKIAAKRALSRSHVYGLEQQVHSIKQIADWLNDILLLSTEIKGIIIFLAHRANLSDMKLALSLSKRIW